MEYKILIPATFSITIEAPTMEEAARLAQVQFCKETDSWKGDCKIREVIVEEKNSEHPHLNRTAYEPWAI